MASPIVNQSSTDAMKTLTYSKPDLRLTASHCASSLKPITGIGDGQKSGLVVLSGLTIDQ